MSQQSQEQYQFISAILSKHIGAETKIDDLQFFYGGNFNLAVRVKSGLSEFFIKWTQGEHQGLFEAEAKNLQLIKKTGAIDVPGVLGVGTLDEKEYLMMDCIQSAEKSADYWSDFGGKLAHLHQQHATKGHGLDYHN
jgi:fructosamine-3-kinase